MELIKIKYNLNKKKFQKYLQFNSNIFLNNLKLINIKKNKKINTINLLFSYKKTNVYKINYDLKEKKNYYDYLYKSKYKKLNIKKKIIFIKFYNNIFYSFYLIYKTYFFNFNLWIKKKILYYIFFKHVFMNYLTKWKKNINNLNFLFFKKENFFYTKRKKNARMKKKKKKNLNFKIKQKLI